MEKKNNNWKWNTKYLVSAISFYSDMSSSHTSYKYFQSIKYLIRKT